MIKKLLVRFPPETLRYLLAGIATTAVSFGVFALLHRALAVEERAANAVSIVIAIIFAYFANKLYVFRSDAGGGTAVAEFAKFIGGRLLTMAVEYFGYIAIVALLDDELIAKAATQLAVFVLNYVISKLIVFTKP